MEPERDGAVQNEAYATLRGRFGDRAVPDASANDNARRGAGVSNHVFLGVLARGSGPGRWFVGGDQAPWFCRRVYP